MVANIKNGPTRTLVSLVGVDATGKGGTQPVAMVPVATSWGTESHSLSDWLAGQGKTVAPAIKAYWSDVDGASPNIWRWRDRVFMGDAVNMLDTRSNPTVNTYIPGATSGPNWLLRDAQLLVGNDKSAISIVGYTQSLNANANNTAPIGLGAFADNNSATTGAAWGAYLEVQHRPGTPSGSTSYGIEIDSRNASGVNDSGDPYGPGNGAQGIWLAAGGGPGYGSNTVITTAPTSTSSATITAPVPAWVASGGGQTVVNASGQTIGTIQSASGSTITLTANASFAVASGQILNIQYPANTGLVFVKNLTSWNTGINFADGSLTKDPVFGLSTAISMGSGARFVWYTSAGVLGSEIRGVNTVGGTAIAQVFDNSAVLFQAPFNAEFFQMHNVSTSRNGFFFTNGIPGVNPSMHSNSMTETDVGLDFLPKGAGTVNISAMCMRQGVGTTLAPPLNGDLTMQFTSNTSVTLKGKGSDGTVRSVTLTLS